MSFRKNPCYNGMLLILNIGGQNYYEFVILVFLEHLTSQSILHVLLVEVVILVILEWSYI